jgi:alkaline phosphatase
MELAIMTTRRSFITGSGLAAAAVSGFPHLARSNASILSQTGTRPSKIIFIVSDGMSIGTLTCADELSRQVRKRPLSWVTRWADPATRMGMMNTRSLNSMVTDSAAAATAWGSGSRVSNGAINMLPDGRVLTPLYPLVAEKGWARGLVTTAEITHATPAGFAAAVSSRGDAATIAQQYLAQKIQVLLGGGQPFFTPAKQPDKKDLLAEYTKAGYSVVTTAEELNAAPKKGLLLGLFADSHLPYTLDQRSDPDKHQTVPTLAHLTRAALEHLREKERFILQVEGARIDHAAHNSDAPAALWDQIALDEALDECLAFQKDNPDTLIVFTTDHANSNLGLNGMGSSYGQSSHCFARVAEARMSLPFLLRQLEKMDKSSPDALRTMMEEATGYKPPADKAKGMAAVLSGTHSALYDQMKPPITQLGQLMANHYGIGWSGNTHTSDLVNIAAIGPGSEKFTGLLENTDVFGILTGFAGIAHQNPTMPIIAGVIAPDVEHAATYAARC